MLKSGAIIIFLLLSYFSWGQSQFTDVTTEAGIDHDFQVFQGIFGGGAAVLDYNNDGFEDVFITGGKGKDALYRNNGDGTFTDVLEEAGFSGLANVITNGVTCADVNKDGFIDIFITTIATVENGTFTAASNFLFINEGNGKFIDRSRSFRLNEANFSTGAAFGDFNNDGYPDLYVSNFFEGFKGRLDDYIGVVAEGDRSPAADQLYLNNSGGSFTEVGNSYGVHHTGFGFGGVFTDYDNDGDLDLMVINDFGYMATPNLLYKNEYPKKSFEDVGKEMGFDFGINAMGIGVGDYDFDGWLDYFVSNISSSPFLQNQGEKKLPFLNRTKQVGTSYPAIYTADGQEVSTISWGVNFFDFDNDMDLDLFIANGCLNPSVVPNPNLMLENINGQFILNGPVFGLSDPSIGRGSVTFDYDNDGFLDLLVVNQTPVQDSGSGLDMKGVRLYRNEGGENNWLKVRLIGQTSDKNGIGSRLELYVNGKKLIREIDGGSSHVSQNSTIAHFGLGQAIKADSLQVRWLGGEVQTLIDVDANQLIEINQTGLVTGLKKEIESFPVRIYPNPVGRHLFINLGNLDAQIGTQLELYSTTGQISALFDVEEEMIARGVIDWELPQSLLPGMYLLKITTGSTVVVKKIHKE